MIFLAEKSCTAVPCRRATAPVRCFAKPRPQWPTVPASLALTIDANGRKVDRALPGGDGAQNGENRLFLLKYHVPYIEIGAEAYEQKQREREVKFLRKKAAKLGFALAALQPAQTVTNHRNSGRIRSSVTFSEWRFLRKAISLESSPRRNTVAVLVANLGDPVVELLVRAFHVRLNRVFLIRHQHLAQVGQRMNTAWSSTHRTATAVVPEPRGCCGRSCA